LIEGRFFKALQQDWLRCRRFMGGFLTCDRLRKPASGTESGNSLALDDKSHERSLPAVKGKHGSNVAFVRHKRKTLACKTVFAFPQFEGQEMSRCEATNVAMVQP
jgi:hypothetical protein